MLDQAILAGEAMREAARAGGPTLSPALCGCVSCGATRMIAAPVLGSCTTCGTDLEVLSGEDVERARAAPREVRGQAAA